MSKSQVTTLSAPTAIGPYSQAIQTDKLLFISGQIPLDPTTGNLIKGSITNQTTQIFKNIGEILKAAHLSYENIVKITVFLTDLTNFTEVNETFPHFLKEPFPARSTIQVAALPKNAQIEIEAIAAIS